MKESAAQKTTAKREIWLTRSMQALGGLGIDETRALLDMPRHQSVRLNPLVAPPAATLIKLQEVGWQGEPFAWAENCYSVSSGLETVRDSEVIASGAAFIQNAASWLPVLALDPQPGERILDVCAAPGGKSSHITALTHNQAELWANDNSRARLAKLRANFARLGVQPAQVTLFDATQLARKLDGQQFDKILLDAPCSGEGLMRYDQDKDFATWSVAHIKRLQQLQKRLLTQAWQLLKPGGTLVYSTCTMAPEENEAVVDYLLRTHPNAAIEPYSVKLPSRIPALQGWNDKPFRNDLQGCMRLAPSPQIEAFFVCQLQKVASGGEAVLYSSRYEQ
ncbi:MAG TPA: RsmB/NOP family class I SAM-dependent RNA methyltransferase [Candidatus Saccharimonadales bacterium]|nr:RsmB/NOP family class I SAM-dependent RNA methyltransferase [Candidatus Saccharimonadales bacterium]